MNGIISGPVSGFFHLTRFEVLPHSSVCQMFIPFPGRMVFQSIANSHILFISRWTFRLFPENMALKKISISLFLKKKKKNSVIEQKSTTE